MVNTMSENRIICGLDIGTTKICAIIGEYNPDNNSYKIIGIGKSPSHGLRKGIVIDIEKTTKSILEALRKAQKHTEHTITGVTIGITGNHIRSLNSNSTITISHKGDDVIHDAEIDESDIERALDAVKSIHVGVDREVIHTLPQKYFVDNQKEIDNPVGMSGNKLTINALIITATINNVKNLVRSVQATGLNVNGIVLESLSSAEAVLTKDQKELGVALIDIGGGTTDITVYQDGDVKYAGVIEYAGSIITRDIASLIQTSFIEAERIKTKYACASTSLSNKNEKVDITVKSLNGKDEIKLNSHQLSLYVEARIEEILTLSKTEIEKYIDIKKLSGGVIFTGGGALLKGLNEANKKIFGVQSQIGYPNRLLGLENKDLNPEYSTAIGLLHWAKKDKRNQVIRSLKAGITIWDKIIDFFTNIIQQFF